MTELVVLADENGRPAGTADKYQVHTTDTPLHFAFSAYLLTETGDTLLTRRALGKKTWPGVWTNSFCGHPAPGESTVDAVRRRADFELGLDLAQVTEIVEVLPDFRYRAVDSSGIVENEICPVFVVRLAAGVGPDLSQSSSSLLAPNPDEVDSHFWLSTRELAAAVDAAPLAFSPWLVEEMADPRLRAAMGRGE